MHAWCSILAWCCVLLMHRCRMLMHEYEGIVLRSWESKSKFWKFNIVLFLMLLYQEFCLSFQWRGSDFLLLTQRWSWKGSPRQNKANSEENKREVSGFRLWKNDRRTRGMLHFSSKWLSFAGQSWSFEDSLRWEERQICNTLLKRISVFQLVISWNLSDPNGEQLGWLIRSCKCEMKKLVMFRFLFPN